MNARRLCSARAVREGARRAARARRRVEVVAGVGDATWRSPVLLIHGDDDRNVRFSQTVDLVQRLTKQRVDFEELIIPDDTHHFFRHANWVTVDSATAAYFERKFGPSGVKAAAEKR